MKREGAASACSALRRITYSTGQMAKQRVGKPVPSLSLGKPRTMTLPTGGTWSRLRMTSTWIAGGTDTFESLLRGAEGGLYIPDFFHGSGMSTFTIAPARAYRIRGGKPAEPVLVSVISGNVMQTLHQIDGATAETELRSLFTGGCGKMEQWPLRVAFGGPYLRVRGLKAQ